jgi:5-methylcytosine-specific restriction endonuclease McrA
MIHRQRRRKDASGKWIEPQGTWMAQAKTKAAALTSSKDVSQAFYASIRVKQALEALFDLKCAYCEHPIGAAGDWDVEHFRPKGRVEGQANHPGYFWLAYDWTNLYAACQHCNQQRAELPLWESGSITKPPARGKLDQFPLEAGSFRAAQRGDDLTRERRLLLSPCEDDPEQHLTFNPLGEPVAIKDSAMALASIEVFALDRSRLNRLRARELQRLRGDLQAMLPLLKFAQQQNDKQTERLVRETIHNRLQQGTDDASPFAGFNRAVARDPESFGLDLG